MIRSNRASTKLELERLFHPEFQWKENKDVTSLLYSSTEVSGSHAQARINVSVSGVSLPVPECALIFAVQPTEGETGDSNETKLGRF